MFFRIVGKQEHRCSIKGLSMKIDLLVESLGNVKVNGCLLMIDIIVCNYSLLKDNDNLTIFNDILIQFFLTTFFTSITSLITRSKCFYKNLF